MALVVMHVALGIMQGEATVLIPLMLVGGAGSVAAAASDRGLARAGGRPRRRLERGRLDRGRAAVRDSRQMRAHRRGARRRAHRGVPRRHADRRAHQSLRAPERPDRRRPHHRRLRHLPVARLSVPARRTAARRRRSPRSSPPIACGSTAACVEVDPRPLPPGTPAAIDIPREAISEILSRKRRCNLGGRSWLEMKTGSTSAPPTSCRKRRSDAST